MQNEHKRVLVDLLTIAEKGLPYWDDIAYKLMKYDKRFLSSMVVDISMMNLLFYAGTRMLILAFKETEERLKQYGYDPDNDSVARFVKEKFNVDIEDFLKTIEDNNQYEVKIQEK